MNLIETAIQILNQISFEGIPKKQSWNMEIDIFSIITIPQSYPKKRLVINAEFPDFFFGADVK